MAFLTVTEGCDYRVSLGVFEMYYKWISSVRDGDVSSSIFCIIHPLLSSDSVVVNLKRAY